MARVSALVVALALAPLASGFNHAMPSRRRVKSIRPVSDLYGAPRPEAPEEAPDPAARPRTLEDDLPQLAMENGPFFLKAAFCEVVFLGFWELGWPHSTTSSLSLFIGSKSCSFLKKDCHNMKLFEHAWRKK